MPLKPEYIELKAFFAVFVDRFMQRPTLPAELQPLSVLEAQEKKAPSRALAGLRMAVNDCIDMSSDWPPDRVAALDADLCRDGILTLSQVRVRFWKKYAAVCKRGRISDEVEYYLVQNVLADQTIQLGASERKRLEELYNAFGSKAP
jgi:hypothetical protein